MRVEVRMLYIRKPMLTMKPMTGEVEYWRWFGYAKGIDFDPDFVMEKV